MINIEGLHTLVIVGALVFVGMAILVFPTLWEQSKRKSSKKD